MPNQPRSNPGRDPASMEPGRHTCPPARLQIATRAHQDAARDVFEAKHAASRKDRWIGGNFLYYRMHNVTDINFLGGYGTAAW
jgi:hypothetical protein